MPIDAAGPAAIKHKKSKNGKVIKTDLVTVDPFVKEKQKKHKDNADSLSRRLSVSKVNDLK